MSDSRNSFHKGIPPQASEIQNYHTVYPTNMARGLIMRNNIKLKEEGKFPTYEIQATTVKVTTKK